MQMWEGYQWRAGESSRLFALQTFYTLSMFSKDVTPELLLESFGVYDPGDED
jgi:hypothetical protein